MAATDSLRVVQAARIAKRFHETYKELAPAYGYPEESAKPWAALPDTNKRLMVATVHRLLEEGSIDAYQ